MTGNVEPAPVVFNGVTVDSAPRASVDTALADSADLLGAAPDSRAAYVALEREIALLLRRSRAIQGRLAGELHQDLDGAAYGLLVLLDELHVSETGRIAAESAVSAAYRRDLVPRTSSSALVVWRPNGHR